MYRSQISLIAACAVIFALTANVQADLFYTSASFANRSILENSSVRYSVQSDIMENGSVVGTLTATMTYGGGTNPFSDHLWHTGSSFTAEGNSTTSGENSETADGVWDFVIAPAAGYQVDGITLFSNHTLLANPVISNLTSNGTARVWDDNQGLSNELLANYDNGDLFTNGDDLEFNSGSLAGGIDIADHSERWSFDSAGATSLSFTYQAGPVSDIGREGIKFDAALSFVGVPEPSSLLILSAVSLLTLARRRRR